MLNKKKRTLMSFDWATKNILRDKANYDILEGFLSSLLNQDIKIITILESESNQEYETDKFNKVDLIVENQDSEIIVVEVQNNREVHYLERLLYGSSKLIVENLQLGEDYGEIKKVISISILYFLLGEGESDYVYHGNTDFYGLHDRSRLEFKHHKREALVGETIGIRGNIFPEYYLIEVEKFQNIIKNGLDEWIYFFKNSEIKKEFKAKNIQRANEKLKLLQMSEKERKAYERYLMNRASEKGVIESAKIEGREEGREEVRKNNKNTSIKKQLELARIMLKNNESLEKIMQYTQLSKSEIMKLKENAN